MAVESPADIAIIGLNRLSLEAGLYARFLGYRVTLLGYQLSINAYQDETSGFELDSCTTKLGRMAIEAQGKVPQGPDIVDLESLQNRYVQPLLESDLLIDCDLKPCIKLAVSMGESDLPEQLDEDVEYDTRIFELNVWIEGSENVQALSADVLIDCRDQAEKSVPDCSFDFDTSRIADLRAASDSERLLTATDDFYLLNAGLSPEPANVTFKNSLVEIRDLFRILGDSSKLDLYANQD